MKRKSLPFWQDQSEFLETPLVWQGDGELKNTLSFWAKLVNCAHRCTVASNSSTQRKKASHQIIIETL